MKETRFKDTEVGKIPVDWEVVRFSDIAESYSGLTYSPNDVNSYGTLVLRSSNIKEGQLTYDDNVYVNMHIPQRAICHEGDILICVRNGSKSLIGKSAIISKAAERSAFGAFMSILRTKGIDHKLLLYLWQSEFTQKQVQESLGATINQITNGDFNRYLTILPPTRATSYSVRLNKHRRIDILS